LFYEEDLRLTERYSKEEISHQLESIDHVKEALLKYKNTVRQSSNKTGSVVLYNITTK